jgi:hypothetical protein
VLATMAAVADEDGVVRGLSTEQPVFGGRLRYCERTRAYAKRRTDEGKTQREIMRCLKRYLAREVSAPFVPTSPNRPAATNGLDHHHVRQPGFGITRTRTRHL